MAIDVNVNVSISCPDIRDAVKFIAETMTPKDTAQAECPPWTVTSVPPLSPGRVTTLAPSATANVDTAKTARKKAKKVEPVTETPTSVTESPTPVTETVDPIAENPAPITPEPATPSAEAAIPTAPAQPAEDAPGPIPTVSTHYTKSDLVAGIQSLVDKDASYQGKVLDLLNSHGARKLSALSEDYYDMFAYQLRQMGAQI